MEDKIIIVPTAEELLANNLEGIIDVMCDSTVNRKDAEEFYRFYKGVMIEYAKSFAALHVEACKQECTRSAMIAEEVLAERSWQDAMDGIDEPKYERHIISGGHIRDDNWVEVDKDSIINAYPLEKIK